MGPPDPSRAEAPTGGHAKVRGARWGLDHYARRRYRVFGGMAEGNPENEGPSWLAAPAQDPIPSGAGRSNFETERINAPRTEVQQLPNFARPALENRALLELSDRHPRLRACGPTIRGGGT